jgi:dipeptidyl aminopeptidase/acylaminoacyl peptidase
MNAGAATTTAARLRPFGPEDVKRSRHVIDAQLSRDGSFAIYQLSEMVPGKTPDEDAQGSSLWRLDLPGGEPRRLTGKGKVASAPQIAPDGRFVYFLAAMAGAAPPTAQIWRLPLDGGEADTITDLRQGVASFALSPDGTKIAYAALEKAPTPTGPHDHVRVSRRSWRFDPLPGYLNDHAQAISLMSAEGGEARALTGYDGVVQAMEWSPDGTRIAAVVLGKSVRDIFAMLADLVVVDPAGGETTLIHGSAIAGLFWTADGSGVGFVASPRGELSRQMQVFLAGRDGGEPRSRTSELGLAVSGGIQSGSPGFARGRLKTTADGKALLAPVANGGEVGIWEIALEGAQSARRIVGGERVCRVLDRAGELALLACQDFTTPSELAAVDLASGKERALTGHNAAWRSEIAWPDVRRLTVESAPGVIVEGWVMAPAGEIGPLKTLLFIHGGPHAGWGATFNEDFLEMAGAGYAVAFANPRGSTGYGDAFSTAIRERWGHPELEDFTAFLDALVAREIADPDRLGVTGVSGGGHLSGWLIGHTDRFKAAVPEQGLYNMLSMYGVSDAGVDLITHELGGAPHEQPERYWALSPLAHAHKCLTPTLLIQGENDVRCPMEQAEQFYTVLKKAGCEVELLRLRGCNHGAHIAGPPPLRRARMEAMRDWFERHIA